ncbi:MAG: hypothetical protein H0U95_15420 [Bacteroidetes bacterium]|nr:hypothetical protein [Bacteroidota bacterium]
MTIALAIEYIPRRMNDIGIGTNYFLRYRHFVIQPLETIELDGDNQFFIQVDEITDITIRSEFGIYDLSDTTINEQQYEHQGKITLYNYSASMKHVRFIQVIPKN